MEWRLFPPLKPSFVENDEVFIRPKSKNERGKVGTVVRLQESADPSSRPSSKNNEEEQKTCPQEGYGVDNTRKRIAVELFSFYKNGINIERHIRTNYKADGCSNAKVSSKVGVRNEKIQQQGKDSQMNKNHDGDLSYCPSDTTANKSNHYDQRTFRSVRLIKRYHNINCGAESAARPSKQCNIFITAKTNHFRNLATSQLHPGITDKVLEIGCSNGECSTAIAPYCKKFIGFDTSTKMIEEAREKMKLRKQKTKCECEYKFYTIDPFVDPNHAKLIANDVNVVLIDIGGNREIDSVVLMIEWVKESLPNVTLIIVKSEEIVECIEGLSKIKRRISFNSNVVYHDNGNLDANIKTTDQSIHGDSANVISATSKQKRIKANISLFDIRVNEIDGLISNGEKWYHESLIVAKANSMRKVRTIGPPKYLHPLRAPMALSPTDKATPICRYYNYHSQGCKYKDECQYDHKHCHWCLQKDHIASNCTFVGLLKIDLCNDEIDSQGLIV